MQISFNPQLQTNKLQKPAFKAVNQGWLTKIIKDPNVADNEFCFHFLNPNSGLSKQDFIDTLTEAAKHFGEGFQEGFKATIEWARKFERN